MIWRLCIRRPVFTIVVFLVLAIFGAQGIANMPLREIPEVEFPIVSISVVLPGADPLVIEREVLEPLERELGILEGLRDLSGSALPQVALLILRFELWRDIDVASQDVRDAIDRARGQLPTAIEPPLVQKLDPDAQPILWVVLSGDERWDRVGLTEYADEVLREQLEVLRGVGRIELGGPRRYAVRVLLHPDQLAARGLAPQDVVAAIVANNIDLPTGRIESQTREFSVNVEGLMRSPAELDRLIVGGTAEAPIRLEDVGQAIDSAEDLRQLARFENRPAVGLGVVRQTGANPPAVAAAVRSRLQALARDFPAGMDCLISSDQSIFIERDIRDLFVTILLAAALVVVVVLAFLQSVRGTWITSLAIPTSLLTAFAIMRALGFSLNTLTMLGLILTIGILIDDAIVVLESIYRHLERGESRVSAAQTGTEEVAFPTIANSLSLGAVFIPVAFTGGLIGRFFREFGLTVVGAVFASTLTALTLTPMLCSKLLRLRRREQAVVRAAEGATDRLQGAYARLLDRAFAHRGLTIAAGASAGALGGLFFWLVPMEFLPAVDRGQFMISFEAPQGATLPETDAYAGEIEGVVRGHSAVAHVFTTLGMAQAGPGQPHQGMAFVQLADDRPSGQHQEIVMDELREKLQALPGGVATLLTAGGPGGGDQPIQLVLRHPSLEVLAAAQQQLMGWMRQQPDFVDVRSDLDLTRPQVRIAIDRDRTSALGVSVGELSETLRLLLGDATVSQVQRQQTRYDVITEMRGQGGLIPDDLQRIHVRSAAGGLVSLDNVVRIEESIGPGSVQHWNRQRSATISASTPPGVVLGNALAKLEGYAQTELPAGVEPLLAGAAQEFQEAFGLLGTAAAFAVIFVFLVLAAQFESFVHPFTIMLTVPLAAVGAFGALWVFGMAFNVYTFIGMIMLIGMATKNAILLVDFANVHRRQGLGAVEAAKRAAHLRLRPVLMTTFSTVLGMLPIALGYGAGGEARAPLGVAVAMGLLTTTLLTLVVIPVVYTLLDALRERSRRDRQPAAH